MVLMFFVLCRKSSNTDRMSFARPAASCEVTLSLCIITRIWVIVRIVKTLQYTSSTNSHPVSFSFFRFPRRHLLRLVHGNAMRKLRFNPIGPPLMNVATDISKSYQIINHILISQLCREGFIGKWLITERNWCIFHFFSNTKLYQKMLTHRY